MQADSFYQLSLQGSPQFQQRNWDSELSTRLPFSLSHINSASEVPFRLVPTDIQILFSLLGPQVVPAPAEEAEDAHSAPITTVERRAESSKPDTSGLALSGPL